MVCMTFGPYDMDQKSGNMTDDLSNGYRPGRTSYESRVRISMVCERTSASLWSLVVTYSEAMLISGASKQISCAIFYIFDL